MDLEYTSRDFTELELRKKMRELKNEIFKLVKQFPDEEKFRLSDQMIRCSRSINANIAEGHGRFSYKDQLHFCIISRGSLSELRNHFFDAFDCSYISNEELQNFQIRIIEIERILNGYIRHLRKKLE